MQHHTCGFGLSAIMSHMTATHPGALRKNSKIGTFTDFLDLHLADSIPRVLAKMESAILAITLYCSLPLSITLDRKFNFGNALD
jgi:hypothetical protein